MADGGVIRKDASTAIDFQDEIIQVRVEPGHAMFRVHRKLLISGSKRFQREIPIFPAVVFNLRLDVQAVGKGPGLESAQFNIYVDWLYSGTLSSKCTGPAIWSEYIQLIRLHCLGAYLEDRNFQDVVASAFQERLRDDTDAKPVRIPDAFVIGFLYDSDNSYKSNAVLRAAVVEIYARHGTKDHVQRAVGSVYTRDLPKFFQDLSLTLFDHRPKQVPGIAKIDACTLHLHEDGECGAKNETRKRRRLE